MASYKNQHFVPRCHLKPFTLNGAGQAINLYNLDRQRGVRNSSVRDQCSGNYFYGADLKLEKILKFSEDSYGRVLADVTKEGCPLNDLHRTVLRHFCYLQHCRTEAASRNAATVMAEMTDFAYSTAPPEDAITSARDAVQVAMLGFANSMRIVNDLKVCLVRNLTTLPFVTSDNPSIMTNRWHLQNPKGQWKSPGSGAAGVLFFLPLTPKILCVAYDGDVYSIPHSGGWTTVNKAADVEAFNQHQFLDCAANIYFRDWHRLPDVAGAYAAAAPIRPAARHKVHVAVLDGEDDGYKHYKVVPRDSIKREGEALIHVESIRAKPTRWPSVITWRAERRMYSNGTRTGYVRRWVIEEGFASGGGYRKVSA